ncbi:DUF7310 family coiled-coil domain-containing protein [Halosimplex halophilum]|uniref:DUF7310 family coiled-coil domain-containing protein n=1 Tax=Halosimplex halophilum TaxID=2559572 RepID=UPI00107F42A9|nr:hypothetical protein [Halosimplex halophilum]
MSERDLDARVDAVERALTDGDTDLSDLRDRSGVVDDLQSLEDRLDAVESRLDELEAGLQAVRGYAGNVRAVNREVERRASAALAKAETVEAAVDGDDPAAGRPPDQPRERSRERADGSDRTDRVNADRAPTNPGRTDPAGPTERADGTDRTGASPADRTDRDGSPNGSSPGRPPGRSAAEPAGTASADRDHHRKDGADHPDTGRGPHRGRPDAPGERDAPGEPDAASAPDARGAGDGRRGSDPVARDDRSRSGGSGETSGKSSSASGTEQFIERVRDAL